MAEKPLNIILIGKTGCGKSSTGNFILMKKSFETKGGFKSTTKKVTSMETTQDGRRIKIVDTPGLFDTDESVFETALKIQNSLTRVSPGPHAFLIVIDASRRYTEEEKKSQHILLLTFGETIFKHAIIIFTHEDNFNSSDELLKDARSVKELKTLIDLCGGRCITVDNVSKNESYRNGKWRNIMEEVSKVSKNGKVCYTENIEIYRKALEEHASKESDIKELTIDMIEYIIRKQKKDFEKKMQKAKNDADKREEDAFEKGKSSGTFTGVLIGATVGIVGTAAVVTVAVATRNPKAIEATAKAAVATGAAIVRNLAL